MPATAAALAAGDITAAHARRLAALNAPDMAAAFAGAEEFLVGQARTMRWADFIKALAYWLRQAREDGDPDPDKADRDHRHVTLDEGLRGTGLLSGELTPLGKAEVSSALERIERELFEADWAAARASTARRRRSPTWPARLGSGATTPSSRWPAVPSPHPPAASGRSRCVSILVGYDAFPKMCELADGTVISPGTAASTLDEAVIERVVLDGPSRVLDLGHQRSFTGAARRAIEVTQRHCQEPGLPRPRASVRDRPHLAMGRRRPDPPDNGELNCPPQNLAREHPATQRPHPGRRTNEQAEPTSNSPANASATAPPRPHVGRARRRTRRGVTPASEDLGRCPGSSTTAASDGRPDAHRTSGRGDRCRPPDPHPRRASGDAAHPIAPTTTNARAKRTGRVGASATARTSTCGCRSDAHGISRSHPPRQRRAERGREGERRGPPPATADRGALKSTPTGSTIARPRRSAPSTRRRRGAGGPGATSVGPRCTPRRRASRRRSP